MERLRDFLTVCGIIFSVLRWLSAIAVNLVLAIVVSLLLALTVWLFGHIRRDQGFVRENAVGLV